MTKKILITGGHLSPALAVIEELKKRKEWKDFFVGRKHPLEGDKALSLEYKTIKKLEIPFFDLKTGRLQRRFTRYTISSLLKIPSGLIQAFSLVAKLKPDIILSFGGYLALPVVVAGWFLKVPIVTHEQTMTSGLANKFIGLLAKKICLSWPETVKSFPKEKVVLTGNPVRREIFNNQQLTISNQLSNENLPLIYITGGSLGAHSINEVILKILPQLLKKYRIIHQCGDSITYQDYQKLDARRYSLDTKLRKRYYLTKFVGLEDIGWVLNNAGLVISRAGANTVTELLALAKPAILIPLPWSGGGEQEKNAKILKNLGSAEVLSQEKLTGETLYQCIESLMQNIGKYKKNAEKGKGLVILNAAEKMVDILEEITKIN